MFPALLYDLARDPAEGTNLYHGRLAFAGKLKGFLTKQRAAQTWSGDASGNWANFANWSQTNSPEGCDLVYSNSMGSAHLTQTLGTNFSINSLDLGTITQLVTLLPGGPYALTISDGIDMGLSSSDLIIKTPIYLAQSQMWTVSSNHTLSVDAPLSLNASDLMISGNGNVALMGVLSGAGRLTVRSSGFVLLGASSTYTGGTELSGGGFLVAQQDRALGFGDLVIPNNSTLQIEPGVTLTNRLTIAGYGSAIPNTVPGAIMSRHPGNATLNGPVTLSSDAGFYAQQSESVLTFNGCLSGNANLIIMPGTGTVVLAANNLYTGTTFIQGNLKLARGPDRLPTGTQLELTDSTNSSLNLDGNDHTVSLLSGGGSNGGNIKLSSGVLVLNQANTSTYGGRISGSGSVIKSNRGTLILGGLNDYTGTTTVSDGTLLVNGTLRNSSVVVNGGILGGTGLITGPVTIERSGILYLGKNGGSLMISNTLTLAEGSITSIELDSSQQRTGRITKLSRLTYGGTLVVNGFAMPRTLAPGQSFRVFNTTASSGHFSAILPPPGDGLRWRFSPTTGELTVVAQPFLRAVRADAHNFLVSWSDPAFHLQVQTNSLSSTGLTNDWYDYPNATASPVIVPIHQGNPALFLRLAAP
jgi:autotransporter-associated beta strand protein